MSNGIRWTFLNVLLAYRALLILTILSTLSVVESRSSAIAFTQHQFSRRGPSGSDDGWLADDERSSGDASESDSDFETIAGSNTLHPHPINTLPYISDISRMLPVLAKDAESWRDRERPLARLIEISIRNARSNGIDSVVDIPPHHAPSMAYPCTIDFVFALKEDPNSRISTQIKFHLTFIWPNRWRQPIAERIGAIRDVAFTWDEVQGSLDLADKTRKHGGQYGPANFSIRRLPEIGGALTSRRIYWVAIDLVNVSPRTNRQAAGAVKTFRQSSEFVIDQRSSSSASVVRTSFSQVRDERSMNGQSPSRT